MSPTFPCPNPACTQVFSPQDVRGVSSLACPKCGTVFQFGAAGAPPARPAKPAARPAPVPKAAPVAKAPPPPPPAAKPVPLALPVAAPVPAAPPPVPVAVPVAAEPAGADDFALPSEPASRRGDRPRATKGKAKAKANKGRGKGKGGGSVWLLLAAGVGLAALGTGAGAAWVFRDRLFGPSAGDEDAPALRAPALNYSFRVPPRPWVQDKDLEQEAGAQVAFRRGGPNAWLALVARDYKDRMPRDDELLRDAVARLKRLFKKGAEWEQRDEDALAGAPAQRIVFTAENGSNVPVVGECLMAAKGGVAYWVFSWTPSADEEVLAGEQQEWADLRGGFAFLDEREGWKGKEPKILTAEGEKQKYVLHYAEGLWEKQDNADDADLLLLGRDPEAPKDARRWAFVRVFVRDGPGRDPAAELQNARAFVEAREKQLYAETKLEAVPEAAKGGVPEGAVDLGKARAAVARLRVKGGEDYEHFFAVAAVPRKAYTLVIVCECAWDRRDAWEPRFGPVLHSLAFGK